MDEVLQKGCQMRSRERVVPSAIAPIVHPLHSECAMAINGLISWHKTSKTLGLLCVVRSL